MYFSDHNPPHFHVRYNQFKAQITIAPITILNGTLPPRVFGLIVEWALLHQAELEKNWNLLQSQSLPNKIAPLE
ncbi:MAG: DUF4160 domain-containing protein [Anaerolineales bacterium]